MEKRVISRKRSRGMESVYDIRIEYLPKTSFVEKFGEFLERKNSIDKTEDNNIQPLYFNEDFQNNNLRGYKKPLDSDQSDSENLLENAAGTLIRNANGGKATDKATQEKEQQTEIRSLTHKLINLHVGHRKENEITNTNEKAAGKNQALSIPGKCDPRIVEQLWRSRSHRIEETRNLLQNLEKLVEKQDRNQVMENSSKRFSHHNSPAADEKRSDDFLKFAIKRSVTLNGFDVPTPLLDFDVSRTPKSVVSKCHSLGTQTDPRIGNILLDGCKSQAISRAPLAQEDKKQFWNNPRFSTSFDETPLQNNRTHDKSAPKNNIVAAKIKRLLWKFSRRKARSADHCQKFRETSVRSTQSTLDYESNGCQLVQKYRTDQHEYYCDRGTKMLFHKDGELCSTEEPSGTPNVVELYEIRSAPNSLGRKVTKNDQITPDDTCSLERPTDVQRVSRKDFSEIAKATLPNNGISQKATFRQDPGQISKKSLLKHRPKSLPAIPLENSFASRWTSLKLDTVDDPISPQGDYYWSNLHEKSKKLYQSMTRANYKRMTVLCHNLLAALPPLDFNAHILNLNQIKTSKWEDFSICSNGPIIVTDSTAFYLGKLNKEPSPTEGEGQQERILFMVTKLFSNVKFYKADENTEMPYQPPFLASFAEYLPLSMISFMDRDQKNAGHDSPVIQGRGVGADTALCKILVLPYCLTITLGQFIEDFASSQIVRSNGKKFRSIIEFLMIQLTSILIHFQNDGIVALPKKFDDFFITVRTEKCLPHLFVNLDSPKLKIISKHLYKFLENNSAVDHKSAYVPLCRCCLIIMRSLLKADRHFYPLFFDTSDKRSNKFNVAFRDDDPIFIFSIKAAIDLLTLDKKDSLTKVKTIFEVLHFALCDNSKRFADDFFVKLWLDEQRSKLLEYMNEQSTKNKRRQSAAFQDGDAVECFYRRSFLLNCSVRQITETCVLINKI